MIEFVWPWCFFFLPLPWLLRMWLPAVRQSYRVALRVPFYQELDALQTHTTSRIGLLQRKVMWIATLIWLLLVVAAARPQWIGEPVNLPVSGRDLMLAVDLSGSMIKEDMQLEGRNVSRYDIVNHILQQFIERRKGDRLGLILFGSHAYLRPPLTFDRDTVGVMLDEAVTQQKIAVEVMQRARRDLSLTGVDTAIGDAIGLAIKHLRTRPESQRVLILLTDGANTSGEVDPRKAAKLAAQAGITIYTIGIGADQVIVPGLFGNQRINPSADLDEETLKFIAEQTGGRYFRARDRDELERIYLTLDQIEPIEVDNETFHPMLALFYWPLGVAVCLSLAVMMWFSLKSSPVSKRE